MTKNIKREIKRMKQDSNWEVAYEKLFCEDCDSNTKWTIFRHTPTGGLIRICSVCDGVKYDE